jgi:hypothetical protein
LNAFCYSNKIFVPQALCAMPAKKAAFCCSEVEKVKITVMTSLSAKRNMYIYTGFIFVYFHTAGANVSVNLQSTDEKGYSRYLPDVFIWSCCFGTGYYMAHC